MAIRGSLKEASLPDVLQLLSMGKKTGCLSVTHKNNFGYIYFDKGRICYALIVNRRDRLGDMLMKSGVISMEQLNAAIELQGKRRDKRLGELLVEQGALSADQLQGDSRADRGSGLHAVHLEPGHVQLRAGRCARSAGPHGVDQPGVRPARGRKARGRMESRREQIRRSISCSRPTARR